MENKTILIVEDNAVFHRQLTEVLSQNNYNCIIAVNEKKALSRISKNICLVIADIDLSETGGDSAGGINLAKDVAEKKMNLPFILISQTPWAFLPKVNSPEYNKFIEKNNICAVLDRNDKKFRDNLIQEIKKIL